MVVFMLVGSKGTRTEEKKRVCRDMGERVSGDRLMMQIQRCR